MLNEQQENSKKNVLLYRPATTMVMKVVFVLSLRTGIKFNELKENL